jgi:hypothetical protein
MPMKPLRKMLQCDNASLFIKRSLKIPEKCAVVHGTSCAGMAAIGNVTRIRVFVAGVRSCSHSSQNTLHSWRNRKICDETLQQIVNISDVFCIRRKEHV